MTQSRDKTPTRINKKKILECVRYYPGTHFRDIQRKTDLATGTLEYHLRSLVDLKLIEKVKLKGKTHYYPTTLHEDEQHALRLLRQSTKRRIIIELLDQGPKRHQDLVKILNKSSSTVSGHMHQLEEEHIVKKRNKQTDPYTLTQPKLMKKLLIAYQESFMDQLVTNFVESWQVR